MTELGPSARALLDAARDAHDPDPEVRSRVRAATFRRIGAGAAAATISAATAGGAAASTTGAMLAKGAFLVAFAGSVALARHGAEPLPARPMPRPIATATTAAKAVAQATVVSKPAPIPVATVAAPATTVAPATVVIQPKVTTAATAEASTLQAELHRLRDAHAALRAGDPARALAILDAGKATALGPEHAGARVLALCALGRSDARAAAESFLAKHPSSPLAKRVRSACAIP